MQKVIDYLEVKIGNNIFYQFSIGNYSVSYTSGKYEYRVINFNTKKEGIIKLNEKNRNIDFIKSEMDFIINNTLKVTRITILDKLN